MGNLLGSASLLVAVAGLIYSVWYAEIKAALDLDVPAYGRDSRIRQVRTTTRSRALPIALLVVALIAALTPPVWDVVAESVRAILSGNTRYDAVKACLVIVFFALVVLCYACIHDLLRLVALGRRLKAPVTAV